MLLISDAPDAQPSRHGSGRMVLISGVVSGRKIHTQPDKWRDRLDQEASWPAGRRLAGLVRKRHRSGAAVLLCPVSRQALKRTYLTMFSRCRQHLGCQCCRSPDGQRGGPGGRREAFNREPGPPYREGRRGQCPARPQGRRGKWHAQGLGGQAEGQGPGRLQEVGQPWLVYSIFGGGFLPIA